MGVYILEYVANHGTIPATNALNSFTCETGNSPTDFASPSSAFRSPYALHDGVAGQKIETYNLQDNLAAKQWT